jgi:glycosidase
MNQPTTRPSPLPRTIRAWFAAALALAACSGHTLPGYDAGGGGGGGGVPDATVRPDATAGADAPGADAPGPRPDVPGGPDAARPDTGGPVVNPPGGPTWLVADRAPVALSAPQARHEGPDDWRDEVIYFVLTDRFRNGDPSNDEAGFRDDGTALHDPTKPMRYHGGDFAGLRQGIDYLRRLGATAIWVTPIVANVIEDAGRTGYAGYWARDFAKVDPHLISVADPHEVAAGRADWADLVADFHAAGLLVVQDIVVNHTGNLALYEIGGAEVWDPPPIAGCYGTGAHLFIDESSHAGEDWVAYGLRTRPAPPFDEPAWYHNCGRGESGTQVDLYGLDDIATEREDVRAAFVQIYGDWYEDARVDGFRMDTVRNVEPEFWSAFSPAIRARVRADQPARRFLQFGEAYDITHGTSAQYLEPDRLDALLNFEFQKAAVAVFVQGQSTARLTAELNGRQRLRATGLGQGGAELDAAAGALNFIDNHDLPRFLDVTGASDHRLRAALMYLLTTKGIPVLYYNSENAVKGTTRTAEAGRVDLPDLDTTGKLTFTLIRVFTTIRRDHVALRRGDLTVLEDRPAPGLFAFARHTGDPAETVIVALNTSDQPIEETVDVSAWSSDGDVWSDQVTAAFGAQRTARVQAGTLTLTLDPFDTFIGVRP